MRTESFTLHRGSEQGRAWERSLDHEKREAKRSEEKGLKGKIYLKKISKEINSIYGLKGESSIEMVSFKGLTKMSDRVVWFKGLTVDQV